MVGASGRQRVQPSCFADFHIPYPEEAVLKDFDAAVAPMFNQISLLSKHSAALAAARDMLLPRLMNNKLRKDA
jgi:type I restriction enzyme S subunit